MLNENKIPVAILENPRLLARYEYLTDRIEASFCDVSHFHGLVGSYEVGSIERKMAMTNRERAERSLRIVIDKRKAWALRVEMEASMYPDMHAGEVCNAGSGGPCVC
jgi:hypothetical protein